MSVLIRAMLAGLAACVLPGVAGCTKTSDGSIEFRRQNMMGGLLGAEPKPAADVAAMTFPQPPPLPAPPVEQVAVRKKPPVRTVRRSSPAEQATTAAPAEAKPAANLNCRNATQTGGRVKFVCR